VDYIRARVLESDGECVNITVSLISDQSLLLEWSLESKHC